VFHCSFIAPVPSRTSTASFRRAERPSRADADFTADEFIAIGSSDIGEENDGEYLGTNRTVVFQFAFHRADDQVHATADGGGTQSDDGLRMRPVPGGFEWSDDTLFRVLPDGGVQMRDNGPVSQPIPDQGVRPDSAKKGQRPPRLD
jgi:hypothetical protein